MHPMEMKGEKYAGQMGGMLSQSCLVAITVVHSRLKQCNVTTKWLLPLTFAGFYTGYDWCKHKRLQKMYC